MTRFINWKTDFHHSEVRKYLGNIIKGSGCPNLTLVRHVATLSDMILLKNCMSGQIPESEIKHSRPRPKCLVRCIPTAQPLSCSVFFLPNMVMDVEWWKARLRHFRPSPKQVVLHVLIKCTRKQRLSLIEHIGAQ